MLGMFLAIRRGVSTPSSHSGTPIRRFALIAFEQRVLWLAAFGLIALFAGAPLALMHWDFRSPATNLDESLFRRAIAVLFLWAMAQGALVFLSKKLRFEVSSSLRRHILQTLEGMPDVVSFSEKRRRVLRDLTVIEDWFSDRLPRYFLAVVICLGSLLFWLSISPVLAMKAAAIFLVWGVSLTWIGRRRITHLRGSKAFSLKEAKLFSDVLEGARAVQSLFSVPFILRRHEVLHQAARRTQSARALKAFALTLFFYALSSITCLLLWASIMESLETASFDRQFFSTLWCLLVFSVGSNVRFLFEETVQFARSAKRIARLSQSRSLPCIGATGNYPDRMVWGFEFDSCVVRGSGRQAVVKKKIEVERGSITILLGSSGSGKSLILEALCGLRPARWSGLRLQDALGNVAEPFAGESFVSKDLFSYVESNPFIFQGSIRENLTLGNSQRLSDATLWQHLEVVGLLPRIKAMGGLHAPLPRGLADFGQSERFRLALIRALLLDRPFLALDDPFRVLDEQTWRRLIPLLQLQKEFCGILIACRQLPSRLSPENIISIAGSGGYLPHASPALEPAAGESFL